MAETANNIAAKVVDGGGDYTVPLLINGKDVYPQKSFDVVSPATGKVVHKCASATEADALAATNSAVAAFKAWRDLTPKKRRDIFLKAAAVMEKRNEELAANLVAETGCPRQWADFNLMVSRDLLLDIAGRISSLEGTIPATQDAEVGAMVVKEPFGVILAIAPW